jgi:hypothetical protein
MAVYLEAVDEETALENLHREGMTDGLPVVIPTRRRIEAMILASGYDGDMSLGDVGPSGCAATVETVAANAVMAGCLPEHFPVVIAAVKAICDPRFDLTEIQVTTHPITPLIIVNGPVREQAGLSSGYGAFGPGYRANASIGRAVRLVMMNIGGGRPGLSDMSVMGSPNKFTFCASENEEDSPWEPLHVSRGFAPEQSAVTVFSVEGAHSVLCAPMPDDCVDMAVSAVLDAVGSAVGGLGANSTYLGLGDIAVIINPQTAELLAAAGLDRPALQKELTDRARHPRRILRVRNPFLIPAGPPEDMLPTRDPATIVIAVAGGRGNYVMVCPTLGASPHHHPSVSKEVEINQLCLLPNSPTSA